MFDGFGESIDEYRRSCFGASSPPLIGQCSTLPYFAFVPPFQHPHVQTHHVVPLLTATTRMDDSSIAAAPGENELVNASTTTIEPDEEVPLAVCFDESVQGLPSDIEPDSLGADLMATVVSLLRQADIPCCFAREAALIYYGALRNMTVSDHGEMNTSLELNP